MRGYLFDLDGTLINSMDSHYDAWSVVLSTVRCAISKKEFMKLEGTNIYELMRKITKIDCDKTVAELVRAKDKIFVDNYMFALNPGVEEFINDCRINGIRLGIVTASSKVRLESTLPLEFRNNFTVIVTSDDGGPGKPDPYPYILGTNKLGASAEEVVVFENAPFGVQAAKAAQLMCVGIGTTLSREFLGSVDYYFKDFVELKQNWRLN